MFSQSLRATTLATAAATLLFSHTTLAQQYTDLGCYSSVGDAIDNGWGQFMTQDVCNPICLGLGKPVMAMNKGSDCWCGDSLPPASDKVDLSQCHVKCNGFGNYVCGGASAWTVYLSGLDPNPPVLGGSSSSSSSPSPSSSNPPSSSSTPAPSSSSIQSSSAPATTKAPTTSSVDQDQPSTVTLGGSTVVHTVTPSNTAAQASESPESKHHSSNTVGIAVGVVVGILALAGIIAGVVFYMKRHRQGVETRHRRNQSVNPFAVAGSPPSLTDSRLDASMVERRNSAGSVFADNQDYSRRILRVANPDDH